MFSFICRTRKLDYESFLFQLYQTRFSIHCTHSNIWSDLVLTLVLFRFYSVVYCQIAPCGTNDWVFQHVVFISFATSEVGQHPVAVLRCEFWSAQCHCSSMGLDVEMVDSSSTGQLNSRCVLTTARSRSFSLRRRLDEPQIIMIPD
jgi:hypothetical protein